MPGSGRTGERVTGPAVSELANAERESRSAEQWDDAREWPGSGTYHGSVLGNSGPIPLFAPGPGATELWQDLLVRRPELRPAISSAEIESLVRSVSPGTAAELDFEDRTDQLRALGNLVCPIQAAVAITVLAGRFA